MNTHLQNREHLRKNLKSKEYRDAFVDAEITTGLAFQIRAMRRMRKWSQKALAKRIETRQEAVSRLENPDYGKFSLETLRRLASAFDVALLVRFVPFSDLIDRAASLSNRDIEIPSYEEEVAQAELPFPTNVVVFKSRANNRGDEISADDVSVGTDGAGATLSVQTAHG